MNGQSVWLGRLRRPARLAMIVFVIATVLCVAWLILGYVLFGSTAGMSAMLRPEGRPEIYLMWFVLTMSVLAASVYMSDTVGAIEQKPTGAIDIISLVCSRIAMLAVAVIVLTMFYEVVSRYVFIRPTLWANELSLWIAGFVFLFAGLYAMQQRSHIRIYVIYDIMPRWAQKLSDCVSVALIWGFTICLIWGGYNESRDKFLRGETFGTAWDPPIPATIKPAILIIIAMVAIQALSNLIADWNKAPEHHSPLDEVDEVEIEQIRRAVGESKDG